MLCVGAPAATLLADGVPCFAFFPALVAKRGLSPARKDELRICRGAPVKEKLFV